MNEFIVFSKDTDRISEEIGELESKGELTVFSKSEVSSIGIYIRTNIDISEKIQGFKRGNFEEFSKTIMNLLK